MLSLEEALLLKAAYEEKEKQEAISTAGIAGGIGGAALGAAAGSIPNSIGNVINAGKDKLAASRGLAPKRSIGRALKPGFRMAGGLTGAILGGALGAGTAAVMKQNNRPAQLLGEIQAKGGALDPALEQELAQLLGELYTQQAGM